MGDVDKLTDAELRVKLMEYGLPPLPVTGTTRNVMIKKLKLLMSKTNANADGRRSLGKYSSGEESESEEKIKRSKRRVTISNAPMQPPPAKPFVKQKPEPRPAPARAQPAAPAKNYADNFDTGSDSEPDVDLRPTNDYESPGRKSAAPERRSPAESTHRSTNRRFTSTPVDSPRGSGDGSYSRTFGSSNSRPSTIPSLVANDAVSELSQIKRRLLPQPPDYPYLSAMSSEGTSGEPHIDTPFLSQFTRRLSRLSASKKATREQNTNGGNTNPYSFYPTMRSYLMNTRDNYYRGAASSDTTTGKNLLKGNFVPFAVLGIAVLFFIFVGFIYLGMRTDTSLEPSGIKVPYCDAKNANHIKGVNCVMEEDVKKAIHLLHPLRNELKERGVKKYCQNPETKDRMEERDVLDFVSAKFGFKNDSRVSNDLRNLRVLINNNPSWGISIVRARPDEKITDKHIVKNLGTLGFESVAEPLSLVVLEPEIPWSCTIANKFYSTFRTILCVSIIFATAYASYFLYLRYSNYRKNKRHQVIALVERILEILQNGNEVENNYLIINHVRDMLIPVTERKAKEKIWNQAVQFITDNESRVRTEVQEVKGEEYYVWRWIGSANLGVNTPRNKSWQGQAFETQTGAVNSLPCSPTPCLKIRGMVEDGDRDTQQIREAVLSKCASKCRILHCCVDEKMKCVYMKCADTEDAAIAYQNLHGWWYAGQLVTVKYLRLERYMQRFPDAPVTAPPYLRATLPVDGWS